ncbi:hypothetical protein Ancab_020789 [Ancistrocladus abbreviatus]
MREGGIVELHLPKCITNATKARRELLVLILVISISCAAISMIIVLAKWFVSKKQSEDLPSKSSFKEAFFRVSYDMLLKATKGFSPAHLIGVGSFGSVYKGILDQDGNELPIAVKVLGLQHRATTKSFMAECKALRNVRHRNLVRILSTSSSIDFDAR